MLGCRLVLCRCVYLVLVTVQHGSYSPLVSLGASEEAHFRGDKNLAVADPEALKGGEGGRQCTSLVVLYHKCT